MKSKITIKAGIIYRDGQPIGIQGPKVTDPDLIREATKPPRKPSQRKGKL